MKKTEKIKKIDLLAKHLKQASLYVILTVKSVCYDH